MRTRVIQSNEKSHAPPRLGQKHSCVSSDIVWKMMYSLSARECFAVVPNLNYTRRSAITVTTITAASDDDRLPL